MDFIFLVRRYLSDILVLTIVLTLQVQLFRWLREAPAFARSERARRALGIATLLSCGWVVFGIVFSLPRFASLIPATWLWSWIRGSALIWGITVVGLFFVAAGWRCLPPFNAKRRVFLRTVQAAAFAAPAAVTGFGVLVGRKQFELREVDVMIPGLEPDLEGLRLVQLSDMHLSPFLSPREFARAVDMANETRAHIGLVTGDLISAPGDPLDECLAELKRLRADAGVFGCLGNHEAYCECEDYTEQEGARLGIRFLRNQTAMLRFGNARLNFAGVDYQTARQPYLAGAEQLLAPGACNILLSHNPDVFPVAARQGYDLTISGHTHGGQVTVEILKQHLNIARFFTPYVSGLYRRGPRSVYVTRGIGTVGVPARIGAMPEVTLLRLRSDRASS